MPHLTGWVKRAPGVRGPRRCLPPTTARDARARRADPRAQEQPDAGDL